LLKLRVILDIDDCIGKRYEGDVLDSDIWKRLGIDVFNVEYPGAMFLIRPGLTTFLQECCLFSEIYLFTAGTLTYAREIASIIDPQRVYLKGFWGAECVTWFRWPDHTKDLEKLGTSFHPKRSVLIDDRISNMIYQPHNGIPSEISKLMREPKNTIAALKQLEAGLDPIPCEILRDNMIEVNPLQDILADLRILSELEDIRPYLKEKYEVADKLTGHPMLPRHWNSFIARSVN
jgi:hypothetical protein